MKKLTTNPLIPKLQKSQFSVFSKRYKINKPLKKYCPPTIETHLAVAAPGNPNEVKIGTPKYMLLSGFAGGIVSGGSHFLVTPLDVVHVRIQVTYFTFVMNT
uniref:Uncharacterized protein n=1 Tax=Panagrolaimus davidi TaxID=227884 RepID=A0A914NZP8_9BILA